MKTGFNSNSTTEHSTTVASRTDTDKSRPAVVPYMEPLQAEAVTITDRQKLITKVEMKIKLEREVRARKFMEAVAQQDKVDPKSPKEVLPKFDSARNLFSSLAGEPFYRAPKTFGIGRLPSPESLIPPEQRKIRKSGDESRSKNKY